MPRRPVPSDPSIGDRIRARRELRGWSIRHAAARAGVSHTSWSRIERGLQRTDRYMIVDLAAALECSVVDLTGQPYTPADLQLDAARIDAERVWRALVAAPMDLTAPADVSLAWLRRESDLVRDLYGRCDYAGALRRLVDVIPALHGADRGAALPLMVPVFGVAMGSLLNVGYPAHGLLAAQRSLDAAHMLDDPVAVGIAAANSARVAAYAGAYEAARLTCDAAALELDRRTDRPGAVDVLGFLHLARAHHCAGLRDRSSAEDHLSEAERIASFTGETATGDLAWGPRNVALWRMAYQVDTGRPGEAVETAARVAVDGLPAVRQVYYWLDLGRAFADMNRGRDAVRMLLTAERVGPQHARSSAAARETARGLLRQGVKSSELRGLCERMGAVSG